MLHQKEICWNYYYYYYFIVIGIDAGVLIQMRVSH